MDPVLRQLVSNSPDPLLLVNNEKQILLVNQALERLLDCEAKFVVNKPLSNLLDIDLRNSTSSLATLFADRRRSTTRRVISGIGRDGGMINLEASIIPLLDGQDALHFIMLHDVNIRANKEISSSSSVQRLHILADLAPIGIFQIDSDWVCTYVNPMFCDLTGLNPEELTGRKWVTAIHPSDSVSILEKLRKSMTSGMEFNAEFRLQTPLGKTNWVACSARPVFSESGTVIGYLGTTKDVTEQHAAQRDLYYLAHYDPLTGLANRTLFQDRLHQACVRSERHGILALMYMDLDGFKTLNDTMGHDAGDMLLKAVAERLTTMLRKEDTIARIGGDEFTLLVEGMPDVQHIHMIATNIIDTFQKPFQIHGSDIFITVSIGISICEHNDIEPNSLLKQADAAMYTAKEKGRNTFQYFTPEMDHSVRVRMSLGNDLHRALESQELMVCYQPQFDINNEILVGAEALMRWFHPQKGMIKPSVFVPLLEERGLIISAGEWLIDHTLKQLRQWHDTVSHSSKMDLSINVSPKQLWCGDIVSTMRTAMDKYGLSGECITVEITESVLMYDDTFVRKTLNRLKDIGISIALDDFGTGYASLSYLKRFPIDHIKIDRSFVRDLCEDPDDASITRAIIDLGHSLNRRVIAEGVDSEAKLELLKEYGCDVAQGFYFSEPVPHHEFKWGNADVTDATVLA